MSRTLTEIYNEAVATRNKYLELTELTNDSKMSIINAFTWVASAAIYSFETMLDVFMTDIAKAFSARINGTPAYYANAMLKWQWGDELVVSDDGASFSYPSEDVTKRVITHVSYQEVYSDEYKSGMLVLKVATGDGSSLSRITDEQLIAARAYLRQIKFAGVRCNVVSRRGDVLVPRLTVYYDGAVSLEELYDAIDKALVGFVGGMGFDSVLYTQKVIDAIQGVAHVCDVSADPESPVTQGVFIAQYDDDGNLGPLTKVERKCHTSSGYVKQSERSGLEAEIPTFREALTVRLEGA